MDLLEPRVQPHALRGELPQPRQVPQEHVLHAHRPKFDLEAVPNLLHRAQLEEEHLGS